MSTLVSNDKLPMLYKINNNVTTVVSMYGEHHCDNSLVAGAELHLNEMFKIIDIKPYFMYLNYFSPSGRFLQRRTTGYDSNRDS